MAALKGIHKGKDTFKQHHNDNLQAYQRCGCTNHSTKKYRTAKHLVDLYIKYSGKGKQIQGDKFEAHFNTQTTDVGCSNDVLFLQNMRMRRSRCSWKTSIASKI